MADPHLIPNIQRESLPVLISNWKVEDYLYKKDGKTLSSGFVMFPSGHARNTTADLKGILANKFDVLGRIGISGAENLKK